MALTIDGTNGIETNTDTGKIKVGASDDLQIYASGSNSIIAHNGDGNLQITTGASGEDILVQAYGDIDLKPANGENGVKIIGNGATSLYYDNSKKFETYASGTITTGNLKNTGSVYVGNQVDGHDGNSTGQLFFGASNDLKMYHDGTDATIKNITGDLKIEALGGTSDDILISANDDFVLKVAATETAMTASANGSVDLYYNGTKKLATTGSGVQIYNSVPGSNAFVVANSNNNDICTFYESSDGDGNHGLLYLNANDGTNNVKLNTSGPSWIINDFNVGTTSGNTSTSQFGHHLPSHGGFYHSRNVSGSSAVQQSYGNAGERRVMGDGDCYNTNNTWGSISDETLKQDIVDAASQWDDIKQVKVRKFRFKNNPTAPLHIGVVAQELETISPGLVKEQFQNGTDGNKVKSVKYSVLYMKAIKALQEAMTKIETLETKVAALEAA